MPKEFCICAALQLVSGELFRGHRRDDAIQTAGKAGVSYEVIAAGTQGFITSYNRFVDRTEGARLQRDAGIISAQTRKLPEGLLFSEDLYLRETQGQMLMPKSEHGRVHYVGSNIRVTQCGRDRNHVLRGGSAFSWDYVTCEDCLAMRVLPKPLPNVTPAPEPQPTELI